ncbi:MAG: tetratricopeptide repeat protein [Phycisphaerales bacterium]
MPPGQPPAQMMERASAAIQSGQYALAESTLRRVLASSPHDWRVNQWLAEALFFQDKAEAATAFAKQAVKARPESSHSHALLAQCLMKTKKFGDAVAHGNKAIELEPNNAMHWNALGACYMMQEKFELALVPLEKARALAPEDPVIAINYTRVIADHARVDESFRMLHAIAPKFPNDADLLNHLVTKASYIDGFDPAEKLSLAKKMARMYEGPEEKPLPPPLHRIADIGAERVLRIGLVSYDFRTHSCAYFIRPILKHVDRSLATLHCFSTCPDEDDVTSELKSHADSWHKVAGLAPEALAKEIAKQKIDVLVELGGYTMGTSLDACVLRPAPLQVTAIGYPGTLGLRCITHRLVDAVTDTRESDAWFSEKLVRLDGCFLCYDPGAGFPAERKSLASRPDAPIRFGSFNATIKITQGTLDLWASVLSAVPGSTLLLKGYTLGGEVTPAYLKQELAKRGVSPERVICKGRLDSDEHHLRLYDSIDIALETVPYNGTTTTCEALMMGVPVVTLEGREHVSRVGASVLAHAGLPELIATSPAEYVKIASELARDRARLSEYHATLRQRVLASRLCDGAAYAKSWFDEIHRTWKSVGSQGG